MPKHSVRTNCKMCGKLFDSLKLSKICPGCVADMDTFFPQVREYLEKFPGSTSAEVCAEFDIPIAIIEHFINEDRLIAKDTEKRVKFIRRCERCNKPIARGVFCKECNILHVVAEMKSSQSAKPVEKKAGAGPKFHVNTTGR